jgi:PAS domain S-box-containing protein
MHSGTDRIDVVHVSGASADIDVTEEDSGADEPPIAVRRVNDVDDALAVLGAGSIDCVVAPGASSDGSGYELLEAIREDDEELPVILYAEEWSQEALDGALSAGVTDCLFLPAAVDATAVLARRIRSAVQCYRATTAPVDQERFRTLIENATDVITVIAPDGTITYESPSVERVLGYEPAELVGENAFEYVHPEDRERVTERFGILVERSDFAVQPVEFRFRTADGEWCWLEAIGSNEGGDAVEGFVVNSRDVSERKARERELETRTEELEALTRLIRHDIRNDMNVVMAWARRLEDHVDAEGQEPLRKLLVSGENVLELTEIAREFVQTLTADRETHLEPVPLRSVLETAVQLQRSSYPLASIRLEGAVPDVAVQANEMLQSVFRNVLNNAVKHTDRDDPQVEVGVAVEGDDAVVRIADNGPGIPDERKETVFGKGEKGLDSEGTGIGLYLVDSLLEQYGGEVWIEDNDPAGTVVVLALPLADEYSAVE